MAQAAVAQVARGKQVLRGLRDLTCDVCEIAPAGPEEDFGFAYSTEFVESVAMVDLRCFALEFKRSALHISRSGFDQYQITLNLGRPFRYKTGRREITVETGDVCVLDMTHPSVTSLGDESHLASMIVPRQVLAHLLPAPDSFRAALLARGGRYGRLVREEFLALRFAQAAGCDSMRVDPLLKLVAGGLGALPAGGARSQDSFHAATLNSIKRYIEAHLEDGGAEAAQLCRAFGISRATLYRLFEEEKGLAAYVQARKLHRALQSLMSPEYRHHGMMEIALRFGFCSDCTFVRAFRRAYGLTPGDVRAMSILRRLRTRAGGSTSLHRDLWWLDPDRAAPGASVIS